MNPLGFGESHGFEGHTRHAVIGTDGRPKALPQALRETIVVRSLP